MLINGQYVENVKLTINCLIFTEMGLEIVKNESSETDRENRKRPAKPSTNGSGFPPLKSKPKVLQSQLDNDREWLLITLIFCV